MNPWFLLAPLFCVAFGGLAMMLADAFSKRSAELSIVSTVILATAGGLSLGLGWVVDPPAPPEIIASYLAVDRMALFLDVVICAGAALAAMLAGGYLREHEIERGEFYVLLLFSAFGAMALGRAIDLLSIFVALETMSLGVYGLVAFRRHSPRSSEGALKYFLLGAFASAILLFGMALLYGATNATHLDEIGRAVHTGEADVMLTLLSLLLLTVGLAFKVSAVPFHMWTPDAYEGAVTPATTFMAVVVKAAAFGVLIRVFFVAFGDVSGVASLDSGWPPVIGWLAGVTMIVGNLAALVQRSVKRMLAYSSISHAGFMLLGVAAAARDGGEGLSAVLYYLLAYTVSNALAFGALIMVGSYGREAVSYEDLSGVGRRHPWVALPFVLGVLSLMGFPPTAGFFAKYYVILSAVDAGMVPLAVIGVLSSAVGAYYYLKVLVFLYMRSPEEGAPVALPMRSGFVATAIALSAFFVLRMGLAPDAFLSLAIEAASELASQAASLGA